jgi:competence protein ComEC
MALVLVVAGALAGYGLAAWRAQLRLADELPPAWEGRDIEVTGIIASLPQPSARGTRFLLRVESVASEGAIVPRLVAITWFADRREEEGRGPPPLAAGERWQLTARLKRPRGLANRHGFDFEPWALERGIRATGYVRSKLAAARLAERVDGWPATLHRWRGEIRDAMTDHLAGAPPAGVLVALVIGDQDAIAESEWRTFWRTGVGHLMSISGLHITMLAGLAYAVASFLWARVPALPLWWPARKAGVVAAVLAAGAYSLLAGYAVPAQRTFVMHAAIAACVLLDRHGSSSRVLAIAALAVLLVDPWAVLSPGFWLSFGAVAAIFYVAALRTGRAGRLAVAVREQLAVTVVMLPMLIALFQEVSIVSPLANAIAIPVVSLAVVPMAIAGALLGPGVLLDVAAVLLAGVMIPLEWLAALPAAVLETHAPVPWTVGAALVGCALLLAPRGVPMRWAGAIWIAPLILVVPEGPGAGEAWVDVLDVGHGLAIVVRTSGHALVYDAGPTWSPEVDSGSRIVVPHLRGEGIRRLDGLVISHADDDHAGGARSVARARAPEWLLSPLAASHRLHFEAGISRLCVAGQSWVWEGVRIEVLNPSPALHSDASRRENDRSCVLRVASAAGVSALLTADIEARSEAEMVARAGKALASDVLLVPHHGSRTSSSPAFLDAVAPAHAFVSLGYRNRFRHPHPAVMQRYADRGIPVSRTDLEGALRIRLSTRAEILPLARPPRYWSDRDRGLSPN